MAIRQRFVILTHTPPSGVTHCDGGNPESYWARYRRRPASPGRRHRMVAAQFPALEGDTPVYVAGHRGLAGAAVWRALERRGATNLIGATSQELDLRDRETTTAFVRKYRPRVMVVAAAKVGGILANSTYPADFLS